MSKWELIKLLIFGRHGGTGTNFTKGDVTFIIERESKWYAVTVSKGVSYD